jgi:hypothetical protein
MAKLTHDKRFTVSLDNADYTALVELGLSSSPPVNLQHLLRLAVRNLLEEHTSRQLTFSLERRA